MSLEPEQERALEFLVETFRRSAERQPFYAFQPAGSHNLILVHPSVPEGHPGIYPGDVQTLAEAGLLRVERPDRNTWRLDITSQGFRYYGSVKQRQGNGAQAVLEATRSYIDTDALSARHADALAKWRQAEQILWSAEGGQHLTTIGHLCRETMQLFATSLLSRHPSSQAPTDPAKTVARTRAAIQSAVASSSHSALLDALISYWGAVADSVQKQEHGAQKEGATIRWEDARIVVFHTLFAMVELDRAIRDGGAV